MVEPNNITILAVDDNDAIRHSLSRRSAEAGTVSLKRAKKRQRNVGAGRLDPLISLRLMCICRI